MTRLKIILIAGLVALALLAGGWLAPASWNVPGLPPDQQLGPAIIADDRTMDHIAPGITLRWRPGASELEITYDGGCMASSIRVLGNDIRTRIFRAAHKIEVTGGFLAQKRPAGMLSTMDLSNCPRTPHRIADLPKGAYRLIWQGEEIALPPLGASPFEIVLPRRDAAGGGLHRAPRHAADQRVTDVVGRAGE